MKFSSHRNETFVNIVKGYKVDFLNNPVVQLVILSLIVNASTGLLCSYFSTAHWLPGFALAQKRSFSEALWGVALISTAVLLPVFSLMRTQAVPLVMLNSLTLTAFLVIGSWISLKAAAKHNRILPDAPRDLHPLWKSPTSDSQASFYMWHSLTLQSRRATAAWAMLLIILGEAAAMIFLADPTLPGFTIAGIMLVIVVVQHKFWSAVTKIM